MNISIERHYVFEYKCVFDGGVTLTIIMFKNICVEIIKTCPLHKFVKCLRLDKLVKINSHRGCVFRVNIIDKCSNLPSTSYREAVAIGETSFSRNASSLLDKRGLT